MGAQVRGWIMKFHKILEIAGYNTVDRGTHGWLHNLHNGARVGTTSSSTDIGVDTGLLDRRLAELKNIDNSLIEGSDKIGINKEDDLLDFGGLTLARDGDDVDLGDLDDLNTDFDLVKKSYGTGKGGELYAYNFPTQGVGAGIGSSALGAGNGAWSRFRSWNRGRPSQWRGRSYSGWSRRWSKEPIRRAV